MAVVFGISLCAVGAWGLLRPVYYTHVTLAPIIPKKIITISTDTPSEVVIPPEATYEVAADKPRQISMPSIGLQSFVQQVGVDQNGRVAVPDNINLVGWFINSARPGERGLSVIDGHVYGQYGPGMFTALHNAKIGDLLTVEYGDHNTKYTFRVKTIRSVPESEATGVLFERDEAIEDQLNLITCINFNHQSQKYDNRLIVTTERI